jgi:hypothetical protein
MVSASEEGSEVIRMAGMAFCSESGISRSFGPDFGAPAGPALAGKVPALGVRTR